jgi:hypothetical protein
LPDNEDRNARYAEILKRIEQRKQKESSAPIHSLLSAALDGLNAAGLLAAIKRRPPNDMSAYGPKTFSGSTAPITENIPIPEQWVGTVMWHKPKGYQYYQTLRLLGIWSLGTGNGRIRLVIGEKRLTYNASIFNPESYYYHIKRKFDIYYAGNASPPLQVSEGSILYDALYDETKRLQTRAALQDVLRNWVTAYTPDEDKG